MRVLDDAHFEPQETEHRRHPIRVALRQILVHRDHVHTVTGERVQIGGQRRHQRLAFARAHLGNLAGMQREAADQLYVEVTQSQLAARRFAHHGKRLGHQRVKGGAGRKASLQLPGFFRKLIIGQRTDTGLEAIDGRNGAAQLLDEALITAAEYLR